MRSVFAAVFLTLTLLTGCGRPQPAEPHFGPDHHVIGHSAYPIAVDPQKVGSYSADAWAGGGYFYDKVLEYRVWLSPYEGAPDLEDGSDYFVAFAQYERALEFSAKTKGAEKPLVLVQQSERIDEPKPGQYIPKKGDRIAEWSPAWLDAKRGPDSIAEFLKSPRKSRVVPGDKKELRK